MREYTLQQLADPQTYRDDPAHWQGHLDNGGEQAFVSLAEGSGEITISSERGMDGVTLTLSLQTLAAIVQMVTRERVPVDYRYLGDELVAHWRGG